MRESGIHQLEVHVAGICFIDNKVLIVKRADNRRLYPGLWECGGGQVQKGESFEEAIHRQLREELGIEVDILQTAGTYEILIPDTEQKKIPGLKFVCQITGYIDGQEPKISDEHTERNFATMEEIESLDFIPGLKEDIQQAYTIYTSSK